MHQDQLEELLTRAVELYRAVPNFSELYMSRIDAMVAVGIPFVDANSDRLQQQMHRMVTGFQQRYGPATHKEDYQSKLLRTQYIGERIVTNPSGEKLTQVYKMKLAGFGAADTKAGKAFMKVSRDMKKLSKQTAATTPSFGPQLPPVVVPVSPSISSLQSSRNNLSTSGASFAGVSTTTSTWPPTVQIPPTTTRVTQSDDVISPLSFVSNDTPKDVIYNVPPAFESRWDDYDLSYGSSGIDDEENTTPAALLSLKSLAAGSVRKEGDIRFDGMTSSVNHRRSTYATHHDRQRKAVMNGIRSTLYKTATVLYKGVNDEVLQLKKFRNAEDVASSVNSMVGIDVVSSRDLREAIKNDNVNKTPPRVGNPGTLDIGVFKTLCHLVDTATAIEQTNGKTRTTREQFKSAVGDIVNDRRKADGERPIDDSKLYNRILSTLRQHHCRRHRQRHRKTQTHQSYGHAFLVGPRPSASRTIQDTMGPRNHQQG